ncbi:MAG: helix-turn-helix domain-containing protein [Bacteriovoracia bacterium]
MKKGKEVSVDEAAQVLGVTPRSVLNYIKAKDIEAIKVGKSWFINRPSLEAFKQRYKLGLNAPPDLGGGGDSENTEKVDSEKRNFPESFSKQKKKSAPVHTLRLFQIAKETLQNINSNGLFPDDRADLRNKFLDLKAEALELVGAGFYSYDNKLKARLYDRSRAKVGGMLSLVYFYNKGDRKLPDVVQRIEHELMPAFSSLIRKLEIKGEKMAKRYSGKQGTTHERN